MYSHSFNMQTSTLLTLAGLITLGTAGYVLEDDYSASSFFNMFEFFTVRLLTLRSPYLSQLLILLRVLTQHMALSTTLIKALRKAEV